jgi:ABC-type phosphate transport system substrate-binding protein
MTPFDASDCGRGGRIVRRALVVAMVLMSGGIYAADVAAGNDVVVVVSARRPLTALSRSELTDIFLGRRSRFPDGGEAVPVDLRGGAEARTEFYSTYLGRSAAQMKAYWSKMIFTGRGSPPREVPDAVEMRRLVAEDPRSIGYLERSLADDTVKILRIE